MKLKSYMYDACNGKQFNLTSDNSLKKKKCKIF